MFYELKIVLILKNTKLVSQPHCTHWLVHKKIKEKLEKKKQRIKEED